MAHGWFLKWRMFSERITFVPQYSPPWFVCLTNHGVDGYNLHGI
jgi:hypothetical protein